MMKPAFTVVPKSDYTIDWDSWNAVGLAGTGAASGLVMGQLELQASLILLLLGWFFVPFYIKSGVFTMPEFLERRYSPAARWYLSVVRPSRPRIRSIMAAYSGVEGSE